MSEHLPHSPESARSSESAAEAKEAKERLEDLRHKAEEAAEKQSKVDIKELEAKAKAEAEGRDTGAKRTEREAPHQTHHQLVMTKELKQDALKKTLRRVQHQLKPSERSFSKFIHQPVVDKVSSVSAETVARPSGVLGGGICALIGSALLLYLARTYGFQYNLFVFVILFVGGFVLGMIIELVLRTLFRRRRIRG